MQVLLSGPSVPDAIRGTIVAIVPTCVYCRNTSSKPYPAEHVIPRFIREVPARPDAALCMRRLQPVLRQPFGTLFCPRNRRECRPIPIRPQGEDGRVSSQPLNRDCESSGADIRGEGI